MRTLLVSLTPWTLLEVLLLWTLLSLFLIAFVLIVFECFMGLPRLLRRVISWRKDTG